MVLLGAVVNIFGSIFYIKDTLTGKTKPNRVTFFLWSAAPIIGAAIALANGAGFAALPVFMAGFCPLLIFIASFSNKKAYWKLNLSDYACGFLSLIAMVLWIVTKNAVAAILFAILSDGLAALPTLIKSFKFPETETGWSYLTGLFNALTSFFAIKTWNFTNIAFPSYLIFMCSILCWVIFRSKIKTIFVASKV